MPSVLGQRRRQPAGQLTWVGADLLAQLQRKVGGVVAVLGVARTLDGDGGRQRGGVEAVLGQHRGGGGLEQLGQVGGGHEGPSYGLGWSAPRIHSGRPTPRCVRLCRPNRRRMFLCVRPRSSGDRASASGAEGRRFESCRGHQAPLQVRAFFGDTTEGAHAPHVPQAGRESARDKAIRPPAPQDRWLTGGRLEYLRVGLPRGIGFESVVPSPGRRCWTAPPARSPVPTGCPCDFTGLWSSMCHPLVWTKLTVVHTPALVPGIRSGGCQTQTWLATRIMPRRED